MPTANDVLNIARSLIGIHETPDGSNIAHPITDWAAQYGYSPGDAWCSWTVSYEFYHTGGGPALIYNHPSGYSGDFRTMGEKHGLMVPGPQVGAIDVMDFDGKPDFTDHVGIVESVNADGSWVNIEGNHNNQVMRVTRKPGGGSHWFILPKYSEVPEPKPKEDEDMMGQVDSGPTPVRDWPGAGLLAPNTHLDVDIVNCSPNDARVHIMIQRLGPDGAGDYGNHDVVIPASKPHIPGFLAFDLCGVFPNAGNVSIQFHSDQPCYFKLTQMLK